MGLRVCWPTEEQRGGAERRSREAGQRGGAERRGRAELGGGAGRPEGLARTLHGSEHRRMRALESGAGQGRAGLPRARTHACMHAHAWGRHAVLGRRTRGLGGRGERGAGTACGGGGHRRAPGCGQGGRCWKEPGAWVLGFQVFRGFRVYLNPEVRCWKEPGACQRGACPRARDKGAGRGGLAGV